MKKYFHSPAAFHIKKRYGLTLVELIVYIGLSSMVIVSVLRVMLLVTDTRDRTDVSMDLQQQGRFIVRHMQEYMYQAPSVLTGSTVFNTASGVLSLSSVDPAKNPVRFFLSGSSLFEQFGSSQPQNLTDPLLNVRQFLLTNKTATGAPMTVEFTLSLEERTAGQALGPKNLVLHSSQTLRR